MCNPVSWFYVVSAGVGTLYISEKTDSHTEIAKEFGIRDTGIGSVCAGEFRPNQSTPSADMSTWELIWDYAGHSRKPDWMDVEMESSLRRQLEQRCKRYVFTDGSHESDSCRAFVFGKAAFTARGSCNVTAYGSSAVKACDSSTVTAYGSSAVKACDSSTVKACDSSTVTVYGSSTVTAYGSGVLAEIE